MNFTRFFVSASLIFCAALAPVQLTAAPFAPIMDLLEKPAPFVTVSPELFRELGKSLALPDAGWTVPASQRSPQYLLDRDLSADEVKVRNAVYTNSMEIEGLRRLIVRETTGDILIIGHSTSGELGFLALGEKELATRLKGRFLGWGSGGPSNLRKEWEEKVGRRAENVKALAKYPPLWELRPRDAAEYVNSGYIGPLNPVAAPGMTDLQVARRWLALVERNRPNFKQVLQDLEHYGMVELQPKLEGEMREALAATKLPVRLG